MSARMRLSECLALMAIVVGLGFRTASAAVINIADYSLVPNGLNDPATTFQNTSLGSNIFPGTNGQIIYVVSTFTFGAASDAHLQWAFSTTNASANRLGIEVQDTGLVQSLGSGSGGVLQNIGPTAPKRTTVNLAQDMAGQSITLLAKFYFNTAVSSDLDARTAFNGTQNTSDDTIMNVWINPTNADVEGDTSSHAAMLGNGDMYVVWNSTGFAHFRQTIQNQLTPNTSGTSTIGDTTILTGTDATFANALALAVPVPEPGSWALAGVGLAGVAAAFRRSRPKA